MGEDKGYKVINEKIVPKKKSPVKRFLICFVSAIFFAVIFGAVARVVFEVSGSIPFLGINKRNGENIELIKGEDGKNKPEKVTPPAVDAEKEKASEKDKNTEKDDKKENITIIEKHVNATLADYSTIFREFGELAERSNKSVVEVQSVVMGVDWFENPYETVTSTSGFIMAVQNDYAYILTGYSAIKKATNIRISFNDGFSATGSLKNFNEELDFALITVGLKELKEDERESVKPVEFAKSDYRIMGEPVMAIGNPNGRMYSALPGTVTNPKGIEYISDYGLNSFYTDIKISENGSGIIMNMEGNLIGLAKRDSAGSDYCKVIAITKLISFFEKMINGETIPYVGILAKDFAGAESRTGLSGGVLIDSIVKDSPAGEAGLREGDIIYGVDGVRVENIGDYSGIIEGKKADETAVLTIYRVTRNKGRELEIEVTIGDSRGIK